MLNLTTPALLFPAISLLLLAYTNRFLHLATLIRKLHVQQLETPSPILMGQITNLRHRVRLIKHMQSLGVFSLFLCVLCMFVLFAGFDLAGKVIFGISLLALLVSLGLSLREIHISVIAINLELSDLEGDAS